MTTPARRCVWPGDRLLFSAIATYGLSVAVGRASAQVAESLPSSALKRMSLEQLMNIEVTSVSRRPERLSTTASAIQVITTEDIRRSGATTLAEALRLAPNLQVAQVNASQWVVSARGFNNVLANKLLVLIDGRTIYTPLYAGVFWDVQHVPLETIDRIEVISGPGGTLWGANAVNGVVNIITKSATETQGFALQGGGGTERPGFGSLRYGGRLSPKVAYRLYGEGLGQGSTALRDGPNAGAEADDEWGLGQGGARVDWQPHPHNRFTLQSDYTYARPDPDGNAPSPILARGGNVLGRWTRTLSERSHLQLQLYFDRTSRDFRNDFLENLTTYDVDLQHRFPLGSRQEVIWGLGSRIMEHATHNLPLFAFVPERRWMQLYSAFVQDEIALAKDRLRLTVGSKFEHNIYTGYEVQPNVRLAWTLTERNLLWGAVSRAVRTPSRIDRDFFLSATPTFPIIVGDSLKSEELLAYELGWRVQPYAGFALSLAAFYNEYDNLRSAEPGPPPFNLPITFANGVRGHTYGAELTTTYQVSSSWRLRGGYTFLKKKLSVKPGSNDLNGGQAESDDPPHQALIQSSTDLPGRLEFDAVLRYVDALPKPAVPSYIGLNLRLGWKVMDRWELSVAGQNLLEHRHVEFVPTSPSARSIERGVYGKITWR